MLAPTDQPNSADPGLGALVMLLRLHGIGADPAQIRHRFAGTPIGVAEMLRCAKDFGLKAKVRSTRFGRLARTPLPAVAALRDRVTRLAREFPLYEGLEDWPLV